MSSDTEMWRVRREVLAWVGGRREWSVWVEVTDAEPDRYTATKLAKRMYNSRFERVADGSPGRLRVRRIELQRRRGGEWETVRTW